MNKPEEDTPTQNYVVHFWRYAPPDADEDCGGRYYVAKRDAFEDLEQAENAGRTAVEFDSYAGAAVYRGDGALAVSSYGFISV